MIQADYEEFLREWRSDEPTVEVFTSGSTGKPKLLRVPKESMRISAASTCDFLGLNEGDSALLCMPLDYIAGKMVVVRSVIRGLSLTVVEPSNRPLSGLSGQGLPPFDFIAMVPSQVYETLRHDQEARMLRRTRQLIIGGGAVPEELERELRGFPNSVWSTYGMTETVSHIAMRKISGPDASDLYRPMAGVRLKATREGCLSLAAPVTRGEWITTNDLVEIEDGGFRILGRRDNTICSGGVKIQIEKAEAILQPYLSRPFAISKTPDGKFGEAVVMVTEDGDIPSVREACEKNLPRFWRPKHYLTVRKIPLTATGKPARKEIESMCLGVRD